MASESSFTFLQSRTKGMSAPIRAIDEIQEQRQSINMGLSAPIATIVVLFDLVNILLKHALEKLNGKGTVVNPAIKHSTT